ncbi:MAG: N-acyl homoserine lactonase family protein [Thermodesulfobacteriota bacterium]
MTTYWIHPIVLGTKVFDKSMMTYQFNNGQTFTIPIYAWYLEPAGGASTAGPILIDTGEMHPIQSADREQAIGGRIHTFTEGLARFGLAPSDIDRVIHTHLHNDHCENDAACTHARILVHEAEIRRIHDPHPLDYRYVEDYILDVEENGQVETISEDCDVAPGIRVVHTPAHTEGGLTVLVDTPGGRAAITGFCVIQENFDPPKQIRAMEMEVIPPGTHVNVYEAYDWMLRVREMADILIPLHEPRFASMETVC